MASRQASSDEILLRYRTVTVKGGMKSAFSQRWKGGGEGSASSASNASSSFVLQGNCLVTLVRKNDSVHFTAHFEKLSCCEFFDAGWLMRF